MSGNYFNQIYEKNCLAKLNYFRLVRSIVSLYSNQINLYTFSGRCLKISATSDLFMNVAKSLAFFLRCHLVVIVSRFLALRDKWIFLLKEVHLIILFLCQALVMNFRLVDNLVWDVSTSFVTFWSDDFAICYEIQILKNKEFGNGCSIWLLYSKIPTRIEQR